jgi:cytochrome c oxidase accessory protein FixG
VIVARHVTGTVIKLRSIVRYIFIGLFLLVPWLQWNGRPAILLDIAERKFYFPGFVIWPQEFYFLMLMLIALGLSLFLFTALLGRIWCGWACPQTLYVELFDTIGRLLLPSKFGKRSEKIYHKIFIHAIWILLSLALTFHFIAYFVPAREMLSSIVEIGPAIFTEFTWPYFLLVTGLIFYADIALFREQFCVFLCPYARFQSVMLDQDSIVIAYDPVRGEPRRGSEEAEAKGEGDCTNCNMCVQVCPTGIDIREGLQVACINCGHCIDACTREMGRVDKKSLVSYGSTNYLVDRKKTRFLRGRTVVYSILLALAIGFFTFLLVNRVPAHLWVIPHPTLAAVNLGDGRIQNYYKMQVGNLTESEAGFLLSVKPAEGSPVSDVRIEGDTRDFEIEANGLKQMVVVVTGKPDSESGRKYLPVEFILTRKADTDEQIIKKANFHLPYHN